jgi:hypothetical protein
MVEAMHWPAVRAAYKNRLAIFYDAPGDNSISHMGRSVGLAWLKLPLSPPEATDTQ